MPKTKTDTPRARAATSKGRAAPPTVRGRRDRAARSRRPGPARPTPDATTRSSSAAATTG